MLYKIQDELDDHECDCGEVIEDGRWDIGYRVCLECGDEIAKQRKFTVAIPYSKGAYQLIHDPKDLFFTNPKRTT
jgi:RNA polymerase-binding transcription factor DksA